MPPWPVESAAVDFLVADGKPVFVGDELVELTMVSRLEGYNGTFTLPSPQSGLFRRVAPDGSTVEPMETICRIETLEPVGEWDSRPGADVRGDSDATTVLSNGSTAAEHAASR